MDQQIRFEDVEGQPVPRLSFTAEGEPLMADGEVFFDLTGAAAHFGRSADSLRKYWLAAWGGFVDANVPLFPEPGDAGAAPTVTPGNGSTRDQLLKRIRYPHISQEHYEEFLEICRRRDLDPWCNQVYASTRHNKETGRPDLAIIIGIEGARLIADRTGEYGGRDKTVHERQPDSRRIIESSTTVYKLVDGVRCPYTGTADFEEYYPGEGVDELWDRMPQMNMERVSEMAALRSAFPQDLGRFYSREEMAQSRRRRPADRRQLVGAGAESSDGRTFDPSTAQI